MSVASFVNLHEILKPQLENCQGAVSFLLGMLPVFTKVVLAVTLRLLAFASYLYVPWSCGIIFSTVSYFFIRCIRGMDKSLDNIRFPMSDSALFLELDKF